MSKKAIGLFADARSCGQCALDAPRHGISDGNHLAWAAGELRHLVALTVRDRRMSKQDRLVRSRIIERLTSIAEAGPAEAEITDRPWVPCRRCSRGRDLFLVGAPLAKRLVEVAASRAPVGIAVKDVELFLNLESAFVEFIQYATVAMRAQAHRASGGASTGLRLVNPPL